MLHTSYHMYIQRCYCIHHCHPNTSHNRIQITVFYFTTVNITVHINHCYVMNVMSSINHCHTAVGVKLLSCHFITHQTMYSLQTTKLQDCSSLHELGLRAVNIFLQAWIFLQNISLTYKYKLVHISVKETLNKSHFGLCI